MVGLMICHGNADHTSGAGASGRIRPNVFRSGLSYRRRDGCVTLRHRAALPKGVQATSSIHAITSRVTSSRLVSFTSSWRAPS